MNVVSRGMTADEEDVKHTEMMMSDSHSHAVEILPLVQAILEILEIIEIEEGVMIKDVIDAEFLETLAKMNQGYVTGTDPGHRGAETVTMGIRRPFSW